MNDWDLHGFSVALEQQAARNEERRKAASDQLDKMTPVAFLREDGDPEGHGIGWFKMEHGFFAFRRYSNGWQERQCDSLTFELVRKLAATLK